MERSVCVHKGDRRSFLDQVSDYGSIYVECLCAINFYYFYYPHSSSSSSSSSSSYSSCSCSCSSSSSSSSYYYYYYYCCCYYYYQYYCFDLLVTDMVDIERKHLSDQQYRLSLLWCLSSDKLQELSGRPTRAFELEERSNIDEIK
jgi:hypothetical protein